MKRAVVLHICYCRLSSHDISLPQRLRAELTPQLEWPLTGALARGALRTTVGGARRTAPVVNGERRLRAEQNWTCDIMLFAVERNY